MRGHRRLADRQDHHQPVLRRHAGRRQGGRRRHGVDLKLAAGKEDGDEDTQIQAIENAISKGDKGILITPNGPAVVDALKKAKDAGLFVIALDTPPDPETADITFATDNFPAGELIGKWTAAQLGGEKATIALIDLFDDKVVSVDYNRDQGFLDGLGIDTADAKVNGDEAKTGNYSGGEYEIVGNEASQGAEDGGRTAMETLLAKNPNINVVYTINEPAAAGAFEALKAAGENEDVIVVSVDGGCAGVNNVKDGVIGATAQQYPVKMAELGVKAIVELVKTGKKPANSPRAWTSTTPASRSSRTTRRRRQEHRHHRGLRHLLGLSPVTHRERGEDRVRMPRAAPAPRHPLVPARPHGLTSPKTRRAT